LPAYGMAVNFQHRDGNLVASPSEPLPEPPPGGWRSDNPREWWNGEWYGHATVRSVLEDGTTFRHVYDCYGFSNDIFDGEKFIYLWDDGLVIGRPTFTVDFSAGASEKGVATGFRGTLFDVEFGLAAWRSDPELSQHKDQLVIEARSELVDGVYAEYQIVLRPWGMLWDDVPENERPPSYSERYLNIYRWPLHQAEIPDSYE